jgi:hypothetical protein
MPSSRASSFSPTRGHASHDTASFRRFPEFPLSSSHLGGSTDAQAIYQLLKAKQQQYAKAAGLDDVDRCTSEENSAISAAATARSFRHPIGNRGAQHSLARADLEALVEARHAATLGLGQQPTQINTNRT